MTTNDATRNAQARTTTTATNGGDAYTSADLERVTSFVGRDEDLAHEMGRTLYAIYAIRQAISEGRATREGRDVSRATTRRVLPYDAGFTTIPDAW